jgi:hypothetical protein
MGAGAPPVGEAGAPEDRERDQAHPRGWLLGSELRDQRDALPGGDQREHGDEVVRMMADPGREAGGLADPHGDGVAERARAADDPVPVPGPRQGLVALGTTGEPATLTPGEQHSVMDVAARVCRERHAPLLAGAHAPEDLRALGERPEVTAALSVVPPFARPGEAGVLAYSLSSPPAATCRSSSTTSLTGPAST